MTGQKLIAEAVVVPDLSARRCLGGGDPQVREREEVRKLRVLKR